MSATRTPSRPDGGGSDIPDMLRRLAAPTLADHRWRKQFVLLRESLTAAGSVHPGTPAVIPGLLALSQLQPQHRADYLAFLEFCQNLRPLEPASNLALAILEQVQNEVTAGEECYRHYLRADASVDVRAAAARLLGRLPRPAAATRAELSWALAFESDPRVLDEIIAALHPLESRQRLTAWTARLQSLCTDGNAAEVRVRAACCRLGGGEPVGDGEFARLVDLLSAHLYETASSREYPGFRLALIREATARLDRPRAVRLWCRILTATREFDGAVEAALQLLRAAFLDERAGWEQLSLSVRHVNGGPAEPPSLAGAIVRLAWAGLHHRFTGRFPTTRLRRHHRPCRDYTGIRAFPPPLDLTDPWQALAVQTITRTPAVWLGFTNLWKHFGLPSRRLEMQMLLNEALD